MRLMVLFALLSFWQNDARAFQTYGFGTEREFKFPEEYLNLTFYISPTYWDFQSQREMPINPLIIAMWSEAFERIVQQTGIPNMSYRYGGTFDPRLARQMITNPDSAFTERKIYIDLTGAEWEGLTNEHAGKAEFLFSTIHEGDFGGGIEAFNTKMFDIIHPDLSILNTVVHEQLHLLGLDHSSIMSARMSYGNPIWESLSDDDIRGMQHLYGGGANTAVTVRTKMDDEAAQGVEVVFIDSSTGQSFVVISSYLYGIARYRGIPPGDYLLVGREITPTGPCFTDPARGFLTSFYIADELSTNAISDATRIAISEGEEVEFTLNLIKGTKRFDCYYSHGYYTSKQASDSKQAWELAGRDDSIQTGVAPGTFFGWKVNTELDVLDFKRTDTDPDSGAHSSLVLHTIGNQHPLTIQDQGWAKYLQDDWSISNLDPEESLLFEGSYATDAKAGTYAAYCEAEGEIAVISELAEVIPGLRQERTNKELFPQFVHLMSDSAAPKSIHVGGSPTPRDQKAATDLGLAVCGVVSGVSADASLLPRLLFFLIPVGIGIRPRRFRDTNSRRNRKGD